MLCINGIKILYKYQKNYQITVISCKYRFDILLRSNLFISKVYNLNIF